MYTAGYVILTLIVNAPLCGPLMKILGLVKLSDEQLEMRAQVGGGGYGKSSK